MSEATVNEFRPQRADAVTAPISEDSLAVVLGLSIFVLALAALVNVDLAPSLADVMRLNNFSFGQRYGKTAIKRTKRRGLLRNAAVALGNSGNSAAVPILAHALENEPEALVRMHAAWALARFNDVEARLVLETARMREPDPLVKAEIEDGLSSASR